MVDARTRVPMEYVREGEIVLNIGPSATNRLQMGNELIECAARFGGAVRELSVPVSAVSAIYARENEDGDTPASYLKKNLRLGRSALDYERVTRAFFAISSNQQGLILYSRCNFSSDAGGAIHCFDLIYPRAEERAWDAIVTRISRSLRPLEG